MRRRQPLPTLWLMTDARFGDGLLDAIRRLPVRSGVIFRHYDMDPSERHVLFRKVAHVCRQRGHVLLLAGDARSASKWRADGFHQRSAGPRRLFHTAPVHNRRELAEARRAGVDAVLISPTIPDRKPSGRPRPRAHGVQPSRTASKGGGRYRFRRNEQGKSKDASP
jgi:thiamine-phosphate pyrophosphorylase